MTCQQTATCQWRPIEPIDHRYIVAGWHGAPWTRAEDWMPMLKPEFCAIGLPSGVSHRFRRLNSSMSYDVADVVEVERELTEDEMLTCEPYPMRRLDDPARACSHWPPENDTLVGAVCPNGCGEL